jgi:uncharacterized protein YegP (UPF0339 family)
MPATFELYKDKTGEYRYRLKAGNGQIILTGEGYKDRSGCSNGIESVRKNASDASRYEKKSTTTGKFRFNLKAANSQVIGVSETYESERARDEGIESVKANAPAATVVDQSK